MAEILAIITARGGSKRIPRKNLKELCGKPLIAYTFEAAKQSKLLTRTIISSDDDEIIAVARQYGIEAPFKRPAELARDATSTLDVLLHAVKFLEEKEGYHPDYVVTLQPTSPLRTGEDIDKGLEKQLTTDADSVVSVVVAEHQHPLQAKKIEDDILYDYIGKETAVLRKQDLPPVYFRNGAFYSVKRNTLMNEHTMYGNITRPYIMPPVRSVDIDDEIDFQLVELLLRQQMGRIAK